MRAQSGGLRIKVVARNRNPFRARYLAEAAPCYCLQGLRWPPEGHARQVRFGCESRVSPVQPQLGLVRGITLEKAAKDRERLSDWRAVARLSASEGRNSRGVYWAEKTAVYRRHLTDAERLRPATDLQAGPAEALKRSPDGSCRFLRDRRAPAEYAVSRTAGAAARHHRRTPHRGGFCRSRSVSVARSRQLGFPGSLSSGSSLPRLISSASLLLIRSAFTPPPTGYSIRGGGGLEGAPHARPERGSLPRVCRQRGDTYGLDRIIVLGIMTPVPWPVEASGPLRFIAVCPSHVSLS